MFTDENTLAGAAGGNQTQTEAPAAITAETGSLTAEVRKKLQNDLTKKIEELRKLKYDFTDADFGTVLDEQKNSNSYAQSLIEEFYGYFEKMNIKIENFSKFNDAEIDVMKEAEHLLLRMGQELKNADGSYNYLLSRPRGGFVNAIVNFFSGLERKTREAEKNLKIADAKATAAKLGIAQSQATADSMRRSRIEKLEATAFTQELTKVAETLLAQQKRDQTATATRIENVRAETARTKDAIFSLTKKRDDLESRKESKQKEIASMSKSLSELTVDSADAIALEGKIDTAKTQYNALVGQHDACVAELETNRTQLLEHSAQDKQLTTQFNALGLSIGVLEANIPYVKSSIENAVILAKNANIIELFSNQHKTNNLMDESMIKMAHIIGLAAQETVKGVFKEQKGHANAIQELISNAGKQFVKNQDEIAEAKDALDKTKDGPSSQEGGTGGSNFDPNNI